MTGAGVKVFYHLIPDWFAGITGKQKRLAWELPVNILVQVIGGFF